MTRKRFLVRFAALLFLCFSIRSACGQEALDGHWEGVITRRGAALHLSIDFQTARELTTATIDIPDLYVRQYQLTRVHFEPPRISFELPLSREPDRFEGTLRGDKISGTFLGRIYGTELRSATWHLWRRNKKSLPYKQEEVSFTNGDVKLAATLMTPVKGRLHPAVVFLHGSGPQTRESYLRYFADYFARRGIATLIYDKRGTGDSTGEIWYRTGDRFDDLVGDALAGVTFLQKREGIDAKRIGLWGLSQGAWLAPLAASRSKNVAFLVAVSGGGVTPAEQEIYDDVVKLQDLGYPPDQVDAAAALLKMADDVIRKRVTWEQFATAREHAENQAWYPHLDRFPLKLPKEDPIWLGDRKQLDFDPRAVWEQLAIPVLAIFGEADKSTPSAESSRRIAMALRRGGNRHYSIRTFPKADHGLWVTPANAKQGWNRPAAGWLKVMTDWLLKR